MLTAKAIEKLKADHNLTAKQTQFVLGYAIHQNGAKAARDAGYSPHTDSVIASENLGKPNVKSAVVSLLREHMPEAAEKFNVTRDKVMEDLEYIKIQSIDGAKPSYMAAVRATELQGRAIGIGFERKVVHRHELVDTRQLINELRGQDDQADELGDIIDGELVEDGDDL